MKSIKLLIIALLVFSAIGCSNYQESSTQEAEYVVEHQKDFGVTLASLNVKGWMIGVGFMIDPDVIDTMSKSNKRSINTVHILVYETKSGQKKLVLLNDNRPPKIVYKILLDKTKEEPESE